MQETAYGFVGAGAITAAIVEGLHAGSANPPAVFLSPRGRSVGRELAGREQAQLLRQDRR